MSSYLVTRASAADFEAIACQNTITVFQRKHKRQLQQQQQQQSLDPATALHPVEYASLTVSTSIDEKVNRVAFSSDGSFLFVGTAAGTLAAFDTRSGRLLQVIADAHFEINSLAVSACGRWLLSCSDDTRLKMWKINQSISAIVPPTATSQQTSSPSPPSPSTLAARSSPSSAAVVSPSSKFAAAAAAAQPINLLTELNCERFVNIHTGAVFSCCFSADGKLFASCGEDDDVFIFRLLDLLDAVEADEAKKNQSNNNNNNGIAVGQRAAAAAVIAASPPKQRFKSQELQGLVLSSTPEEKKLQRSSSSPQSQQQQQQQKQIYERISVPSRGSATAVIFTHESRMLIVGDHFGGLHWVDCMATKKVVRTVQAHQRGIASLAISSCGMVLATGSFDCTVRLFSAATGVMKCEPMRGAHTSFVKSVAFARTAAFSHRQPTMMTSFSSCSQVSNSNHSSTGSTTASTAATTTTDSAAAAAVVPLLLVSTCLDGTCCFWDGKTGQQIGPVLTLPASKNSDSHQHQHHCHHHHPNSSSSGTGAEDDNLSGDDDDDNVDDDDEHLEPGRVGRFESAHSSSKSSKKNRAKKKDNASSALFSSKQSAAPLSFGCFSPDGRTFCLAAADSHVGCRLLAIPPLYSTRVVKTAARGAPIVLMRFLDESGATVGALQSGSNHGAVVAASTAMTDASSSLSSLAAFGRAVQRDISIGLQCLADDDSDNDDDGGAFVGESTASGMLLSSMSARRKSARKRIVALEARDVHNGEPIRISLVEFSPAAAASVAGRAASSSSPVNHKASSPCLSPAPADPVLMMIAHRAKSSPSPSSISGDGAVKTCGSGSNNNNNNSNNQNGLSTPVPETAASEAKRTAEPEMMKLHDPLLQQQQQQQSQKADDDDAQVASPRSIEAATIIIDDVEAFMKKFPANFIFSPTDIEMISPIASGGQGTVFKARVKSVGWLVAAKLYRDKACVSDMLREIDLAMTLRHPNIVAALGVLVQKNIFTTDLVLLMELAECSLHQFLVENRTPDFNVVIHLMRQVASGLQHLHSRERPICWRDLKPGNIVLFNNRTVAKLADWGIARQLRHTREDRAAASSNGGGDSGKTNSNGSTNNNNNDDDHDENKRSGGNNNMTTGTEITRAGAGTIRWQCPESLRGERFIAPNQDSYSFGVMLFQMLQKGGEEPWRNCTFHEIVSGNLAERFMPRAGAPQWLVELTRRCLSHNPRERPRNGAELLRIFDENIMLSLLQQQQQQQQPGGDVGTESSFGRGAAAAPAAAASFSSSAAANASSMMVASASRSLMISPSGKHTMAVSSSSRGDAGAGGFFGDGNRESVNAGDGSVAVFDSVVGVTMTHGKY